MSKHENITPEQVQEMEETIKGLRNEVVKYKELRAESDEKHKAEIAELMAKHKEEVQDLEGQVRLLEMHIEQLITDNTIMDAQLDIVKMMCGVHE